MWEPALFWSCPALHEMLPYFWCLTEEITVHTDITIFTLDSFTLRSIFTPLKYSLFVDKRPNTNWKSYIFKNVCGLGLKPQTAIITVCLSIKKDVICLSENCRAVGRCIADSQSSCSHLLLYAKLGSPHGDSSSVLKTHTWDWFYLNIWLSERK